MKSISVRKLVRETPYEVEHFSELEFLHDTIYVEIDENPPNSTEIRTILLKMKNGKSSGVDEIPMEVMKYICALSALVVDEITKLHVKIWETELVPSKWLESSMYVIFKKKYRKIDSRNSSIQSAQFLMNLAR